MIASTTSTTANLVARALCAAVGALCMATATSYAVNVPSLGVLTSEVAAMNLGKLSPSDARSLDEVNWESIRFLDKERAMRSALYVILARLEADRSSMGSPERVSLAHLLTAVGRNWVRDTPASGEGWFALAAGDVQQEGVTPGAIHALRRSWALAPFQVAAAEDRLGLTLLHWSQMPPDVRSSVEQDFRIWVDALGTDALPKLWWAIRHDGADEKIVRSLLVAGAPDFLPEFDVLMSRN